MVIEELLTDTNLESGDHVTVKGRSIEATLLERRIVWSQTILTGSLQTAIQTLLNNNIISPTITERKIDNFIFSASEDTYITGLTIDAQYFGENLYTVICDICTANKLGFKIDINDQNQFIFSLYRGTDRSYQQLTNPYIIFSQEYNNMLTSNHLKSIVNYKNVTLVAGEGEGSARKTVAVGTASGLNRRELFTDAGSSYSNSGSVSTTTYTAQLTTRGNEELAKYPVKTAFDGEL